MNKRFKLSNFSSNVITKDTYIEFHKLIDDGDEKGAIKLLKKYGNSFNVNYECKMKIPIYSAINKKMYDLYDEIVKHPTFDAKTEDEFGESLLHSLLYLRGSAEELQLQVQESEKANIDRMIQTILNNKKFDFNQRDINNDTPILVVCEYPNLVWCFKTLASDKSVDVNVVDDLNYSLITKCIDFNNLEALKILSARKDLIVRPTDLEKANEVGIDLTEFGFEIAEKFKKAHEYAIA